VTDEALTSRTGTERITTRVPKSLLENFDEATDNRSETIRELMRMYVGRENDITIGRTDVSAELCDKWRKEHREGKPQDMIVTGKPWSQSTVSRHILGKCSHSEEDAEPTEPAVPHEVVRD